MKGYMPAGGRRGPIVPPEPRPRSANFEPQIPAPKGLPYDAPGRVALRRVNRTIEITHTLRDRVVSGAYAPGEQLPSMHVIGQEFGVTESVVQKAVERLREMGLLRTVIGRGTWVVDKVTARARMRVLLAAIRSGDHPQELHGQDAGPLVSFPAAWVDRLIAEAEALEAANIHLASRLADLEEA